MQLPSSVDTVRAVMTSAPTCPVCLPPKFCKLCCCEHARLLVVRCVIYYGAAAALCIPERAGSGACVDPCSHGHCPPRPGVASMHSPGSPTAMTGHVIPRMLVCSLRVFVLAVLHCSSVYHTTTRGNRLRAHRGGHSATLAWPASGRTRRHAAISSSMYSTVSSSP